MATAAQIMARHGIVRPDEVAKISRKVGLEPAIACTLLEKESGGGHNVWGHDPVACGPRGGEVTEANYREYKRNRSRCGSQGCGPTQLTFGGFQDRADTRGGCWKWEVNLEVGFEIMAGYVRKFGLWEAAKKYNGAGRYANDFVAKHRVWSDRLKHGGNFSTWGTNVKIRKQPSVSASVVATLGGPTRVTVKCQKHAEKVVAEGHTNDAWSFLSSHSGWISNIYIDHPAAWLPQIATCP